MGGTSRATHRIFTLADLSSVWVEVAIHESHYGALTRARDLRMWLPVVLAAAGVAASILGSIYAPLFQLTFIGIPLAWLWAYVQFRDRLRRSRLLFRIGECSMLIFLLNAIVRNQLVRYASSPASQLYWGFLSAALSIAISNLIARWLEPQRTREALTGAEVPASSNA